MKYFCLLLGIFCFGFVFAQKVTVSEQIVLRSDIAYNLLGEMGGRTLLLRDMGVKFEVVGFDKALKQSWQKELELDRRQPKIISVIPGDTSFSIVYKFKQKSDLITKIHKYGPGANLLDSITIKNYGYLFYNPNITAVQSEDRTKVLLYFVEKQDIFQVVSFDLVEMKPLWEAVIKPPEFTYFQDFHDLLVDNDGNMALILQKDNFRNKKEIHHYEFHYYNGAQGQLYQFNVPMQEKLTYDVKFTFDHLNKKLVGAGFYSEKNLGLANGYFYLSIDPMDYGNFLLAFNEFDDEFMVNLLGKDANPERGIPDIEVANMVLRLDGGVLLIGERVRSMDRRAATVNRTYYDTRAHFAVDYYFEDIFISSIHPDGSTHWNTVMHKKQYSQDDEGVFSSFFLFKTGSSLRFIFNDEIKYENTVSEYMLRGNGKFDRNSLMSTERLKLRLRFIDALQVDGSSVIIPSEYRNKLKLVRFEY
jgi:hypothetical protein